MKTIDFLDKNKDACADGEAYARQYEMMEEVWGKCDRVDWMIWILKRVDKSPGKNEMRLFNCWCSRATPIGDGRTTWDLLVDPRSRAAIEVAERFAAGEATREELSAAHADAADAEDAADSAAYATDRSASNAADSATWSAASDATYSAAYAPDRAARSASAAARAASDAASARRVQTTRLREMFGNPFMRPKGL